MTWSACWPHLLVLGSRPFSSSQRWRSSLRCGAHQIRAPLDEGLQAPTPGDDRPQVFRPHIGHFSVGFACHLNRAVIHPVTTHASFPVNRRWKAAVDSGSITKQPRSLLEWLVVVPSWKMAEIWYRSGGMICPRRCRTATWISMTKDWLLNVIDS